MASRSSARTKEAENATSAPLLMSVSVVALAICCVIGGVAAPWLLPMLSAAVPLPLEPANTTVSQPMITLLLIACPLLPFIIMAICKGDRLPSRSRGAAWVCGYDHEKSMVITAHGFAMPVKQAFAPVLKLRKWLNPVSLVPGWQCEGRALLFRRMALVELAVLVLFAVAPLLSGITRVARARLHNRRGPGVLQEYRDIIKLLGRQSVGPDASGWVFRLTPYVMVGVMLTIATALPVVTVGSPLPQLGDLITLLYLFAIARFFFAISGLDTGSPFTAIGASREAMLGVLVEPMLLLGLWGAAQVAGSTNISNITDTVYHWPLSQSIPLVLALCACAFATFIEMGKLPFDLAEAEQELQEGPLSEYSGSGFGVMKWGISLKQLVVLQMFVGVFIPWGQMETFTVGGLLLALVIAIVKLVVGVLVIALFENSMARLRLDITPRITWAGFGFAFLAFVSLLAA